MNWMDFWIMKRMRNLKEAITARAWDIENQDFLWRG
jgi:hypothetical protein